MLLCMWRQLCVKDPPHVTTPLNVLRKMLTHCTVLHYIGLRRLALFYFYSCVEYKIVIQ